MKKNWHNLKFTVEYYIFKKKTKNSNRISQVSSVTPLNRELNKQKK